MRFQNSWTPNTGNIVLNFSKLDYNTLFLGGPIFFRYTQFLLSSVDHS